MEKPITPQERVELLNKLVLQVRDKCGEDFNVERFAAIVQDRIEYIKTHEQE